MIAVVANQIEFARCFDCVGRNLVWQVDFFGRIWGQVGVLMAENKGLRVLKPTERRGAVMRIGTTKDGELVEVVECVDGYSRSIAVGGELCSYQFYGPTIDGVAKRVVERGREVLEPWEKVGRRVVDAM